jgi:hypothetical protein
VLHGSLGNLGGHPQAGNARWPRARAYHPTSGGRSSTSARVPDRVVRRGRSGVQRWPARRGGCQQGESADALHSVECPPTGRGSRRSMRCARLELELITPLHAGVRIATYGCAAPARCGAFADERRIVERRWRRRTKHGRRQPRAGSVPSALAYALPSVAWPPTGRGSRRSIRFHFSLNLLLRAAGDQEEFLGRG